MLQKMNHRYTLLCSNSVPISRQSIKVRTSYNNLKKCCEKKKNTKKIRQTLKAHILGTAQIWNWRYPPQKFTQKIFCVFVQGLSSYWCVKTAFLYSCKIYTCLLHAQGLLGCMTHYRVSHYRVSWCIMLIFESCIIKKIKNLIGYITAL